MLSIRNFGLRKIKFATLALLLAVPLAVVAQVTTATIVGTITDPGGAIMPGAQVTARNLDNDGACFTVRLPLKPMQAPKDGASPEV